MTRSGMNVITTSTFGANGSSWRSFAISIETRWNVDWSLGPRIGLGAVFVITRMANPGWWRSNHSGLHGRENNAEYSRYYDLQRKAPPKQSLNGVPSRFVIGKHSLRSTQLQGVPRSSFTWAGLSNPQSLAAPPAIFPLPAQCCNAQVQSAGSPRLFLHPGGQSS
jgi:hypothetical protein